MRAIAWGTVPDWHHVFEHNGLCRYPDYASSNSDGYHWREAVSPNSKCGGGQNSRQGYIGQLSDLAGLLGNRTYEDFLGIPGEWLPVPKTPVYLLVRPETITIRIYLPRIPSHASTV